MFCFRAHGQKHIHLLPFPGGNAEHGMHLIISDGFSFNRLYSYSLPISKLYILSELDIIGTWYHCISYTTVAFISSLCLMIKHIGKYVS